MKDSTKVGGRGWMMMDEVGRGLAQPRAADSGDFVLASDLYFF